jgi:hypothetical protein
MRSWERVIALHEPGTFDSNWRKQVLAFQMLAVLYANKKKLKSGLKAVYQA